MKITQITLPPPQVFTPVTLEITIESFDELMILWHRININWNVIKENINNSLPRPEKDLSSQNFWNVLEQIQIENKGTC